MSDQEPSDPGARQGAPPPAEPKPETVKAFLDGYTRFYTATHTAARAYTNLIMAVGYAGVFGLWSLTRQYLRPRLDEWVAVFLLISLSTFVLFEVIKTFLFNWSVLKRAKLLFAREDSLAVKVAKLERFEFVENAADESRFIPYWIAAWTIAVVFGVLAIAVLMFSLLCSLVNLP